MFRISLWVCIALIITSFFSCGENDISNPGNDEKQAPTPNSNDNQNLDDKKLKILEVLDKYWKTGYEKGETETYMKAFWKEDFQHVLDDGNTTYDYDKEEEAANRVFGKYKDIKMEVPEIQDPSSIEWLNEAETEAKVTNTYKIQFILKDKTSDQCVYEGYYAEGENTFIFNFRSNEWRITYWKNTDTPLD